ncbi:MAG: hypothetical protein JRI80_04790 [Deltaproteobacteria bacterium]|nr:hypothetical protein [Deltaproteobacteria bacterium]
MNTELEVLTDTLMHISEVRENLAEMTAELTRRGIAHDRSKLEALEFDAFVSTRPKFKKANYGSPEYQECVDAIKPAVDHHYSVNRHHTGFHVVGFAGMNLFDILEMLADWKAAARRSPDLSFEDSLPKAFEKYNIPRNMQRHIMTTLRDLGWIE